ncbi:MAG TPA: hypothetical protein PKE31_03140 [Pseudomonadota bacterium]|nr:hypothetical protein [Pseudomonadota bacterium]
MPIYEYECECGAQLESLETLSTSRTHCGELCKRTDARRGLGTVRKLMSAAGIRGDGREAKEPICDVTGGRKRPGCEDCECNLASFGDDDE